MLLPFYYIPQFAWSQSLETAQDNAYTRAQTEHVQVGDISILLTNDLDKACIYNIEQHIRYYGCCRLLCLAMRAIEIQLLIVNTPRLVNHG
jgi:hypothetical protein